MKMFLKIVIYLFAIYIIGTIIAWDYNLLNWYMINDPIGRSFFLLILFIIYVVFFNTKK
jgi:hypothetical protein